jgi:hypothetical protein
MSIYDEMQGVATELFGEFQQGSIMYVELQMVSGGTPDDPNEAVRVEYMLTATARPVSTRYIDGSHIVQSDKQVSMPGGGVEPQMSGFLLIDAVQHKIIGIKRIPEAGTVISYILIVRR